MYGVVNGAGGQTRKAYKDKVPTTNLFAMAPDFVGGGQLLPNNASNIVGPSIFDGAASSTSFSSMTALVFGLVAALMITQC